MGLLDDAIREHLDLKRRRGADPAEIERLEREALGPARRAPEPEGLEGLHDDAGIGAAPSQPEWHESDRHHERHEPDVEPSPGHGLSEGPYVDDAEPPAATPQPRSGRFRPLSLRERMRGRGSAAGPLADEPEAPRHDRGEPAGIPPRPGITDEVAPPKDASDRLEPSERAADAAAAPPQGGSQAAGELPQPVVFDHLDQPTAEYDVSAAPAEGEDVLEETPDFLQDTPDHDRLWFEQRPPRDFDFEG
jgi:hypothetical protein